MLFLTEQDVQELFPMAEAIERVQASLTAQARGQAINRSRERIFLPHTSLHYMAAALAEEHLVGIKIYTASRDAVRFLVLLYDGTTGQLLCALEADHLGRIRTGAASAVATRYLARADANSGRTHRRGPPGAHPARGGRAGSGNHGGEGLRPGCRQVARVLPRNDRRASS